MPRGAHNPLTAAEWKVMRIVWEKRSCSARDVYKAAGETHDWAAGTVKTVLRRLVQKGHLRTTQVGNSFLYRPARPALSSLYRAADTILENAVDGTIGPLLAYMAKKGDLSAEELAKLRASLKDLRARSERSDPH